MQIEKIHETDLSASDEAEIATHLAKCFDTDFAGRSYYQQRHHIRFLFREKGELCGHIALCFRDIRLGKRLVPILGVAEVATLPAMRGRGIASQLLTSAIAFSERSQAKFMMLFGDQPLYAGHGFQTMHNPIRFIRMTDATTIGVEDGIGGVMMVRPTGNLAWNEDESVDFLGHLF